MKITALDIRKQEFARTFRGYDPEEVDSFLHVISMGWQEMVDELRRFEEKISEQQMRLDHYTKVEEALGDALQTARTSARETVENAERKAAAILEGVEDKVIRLQKEADEHRLDMKRETARYAVRQQEIVAKLRSFLVSEMEMLHHFESGMTSLPSASAGKEIEMYRDEERAEVARSADAAEASHVPVEEVPVDDAPVEDALVDNALVDDASVENATGSGGAEKVEERVTGEAPATGGDTPAGESAEAITDEINAVSTEESSEEVSAGETEPNKEESVSVWDLADQVSGSDLQPSSTATPEGDSGEDEIRKIHEILKGLDKEQDGIEGSGPDHDRGETV
ncbi:MAG: DivIVA domain-containing protein [Rhodothermales bacterium]